MKKFILGTFAFLSISITVFAQEAKSVYATMDIENAAEFKAEFPDQIDILGTGNGHAAVFISENVRHLIHDKVKTHGPGYVFKTNEAAALKAINRVKPQNRVLIDYTIDQDALVNQGISMVDGDNIETDILILQNYGTRYHNRPAATQSVLDLKDRWDGMIAAAGRTDVHTRIYNHVNTNMPSVILTFDGAQTPNEFVIIGGHIDSTSFPNNDNAPGADDDASGIATMTEMVRVLLDMDFVPNRSIEVMAFAAEEIGLVGSEEIAQNYASNNVDVAAFVQFDMTAFKGSSEDVYITTDFYNSQTLNNYLIDLMDHYNSTGEHAFTYGFSQCNYGCSDHFSWADAGYDAAFPFEAELSDSNPNIHSPQDVYTFLNNTDQSVKFAKLGLEFLIEAAKPATLSVEDFSEKAVSIYMKDKSLNYLLRNSNSNVTEISIYTIAGQKITTETMNAEAGSISLSQFAQGFYIAKFTMENNHTVTKKFVLN
ncbi:M20/M25/M40 family metallo-hydrolase [Aequorivita echinoideorum]|uniref:M20/M25/M40 family metallo-hydrolase n=1 Tax=Aequorivita echinoideorum TaxID=1549647 RepID=A0ABS5S4Y6_9FLAO|nr:M20/M25/M40 family metallo-hydrolase [Aequorivita echinoideorum]MBT0607469.1 M20/M25/M40 family metallo-hydrolase [Aequorivita echinoideorum]